MSLVSALQIPYREARDGFWGEQTSTLNWCEEDYNVTYYIAEFINTITNLMYIYLGAKGMRNIIKYDHPSIFILCWGAYTIVGFGSMAFHATLKYSMQLADELPMIYSVCMISYAAFSYGRSQKAKALIATSLVGLATFITVYYLYAKDPVFHQVAYGTLCLATVSWGFYVMESRVRPTLKKNSPADADRIMRETWTLALSGIFMFLLGFFIWNMDNIFCRHLTAAKHEVQLPWAAVLEGHGWWHILTGLGAYNMFLWRVWVVCCLEGREKEHMLEWKRWSVPQVVPKPGKGKKQQ